MRLEPELNGYLITTYRHSIHQVSFLVFKRMVNISFGWGRDAGAVHTCGG